MYRRETKKKHNVTLPAEEMPFISKDWRAEGDEWIKTNDGNWERKKEIECESKR